MAELSFFTPCRPSGHCIAAIKLSDLAFIAITMAISFFYPFHDGVDGDEYLRDNYYNNLEAIFLVYSLPSGLAAAISTWLFQTGEVRRMFAKRLVFTWLLFSFMVANMLLSPPILGLIHWVIRDYAEISAFLKWSGITKALHFYSGMMAFILADYFWAALAIFAISCVMAILLGGRAIRLKLPHFLSKSAIPA